eukprot:SAG31_NODE_17632_length_663_cov_1.874113_1_plen_76_part_01
MMLLHQHDPGYPSRLPIHGIQPSIQQQVRAGRSQQAHRRRAGRQAGVCAPGAEQQGATAAAAPERAYRPEHAGGAG